MSGYGPISLLVGVIIGVAFFAIQMNMMNQVSDAIDGQFAPMTYRNETVEAAAAVVEAKNYEMFDARGRAISARQAAPLLTPERFSDVRRASVTTFVDPADLLKEGEAMPEGEMQALMVEARATRLADAACARLVAGLAAECGVRGFEVERIDPPGGWMDEDRTRQQAAFEGMYALTTSMVFTPRDPVGALPDSPRVTLQKKTFKLDPWSIPSPSSEAVAARTDEVLVAAARACADIREVHGNCTVTEVSISRDRPYAGELRSAFELAWLTPLLSAAVAEVAAPAADTAQGQVPVAPEPAPDAPRAPEAPLPADEGAASPATPADRGPAPTPTTPLNGGKAGKWVSP